jgi:hypothetical protein
MKYGFSRMIDGSCQTFSATDREDYIRVAAAAYMWGLRNGVAVRVNRDGHLVHVWRVGPSGKPTRRKKP